MKKAKIAIVSLGHYVYFQQFEGLREELMQKSIEFRGYLNLETCDVVDVGYIDCAESAFEGAQKGGRRSAFCTAFHLRPIRGCRTVCKIS